MGEPYKASRKGQSGRSKEKSCIRVLDLVQDTPASPKDANADAETGDIGWEGRRRYGSKSMNIVLFTESPDSDDDYKFHKKSDNYGGNSEKK